MKTIPVMNLLGMVIFVIGSSVLGWGLWPLKKIEHTLTFTPAQMVFLGENTPWVQETRVMELMYPPLVRIGDKSRLRIVFRPLESESKANLPEKLDELFVETRLELPGISIDPFGVAGQALSPGRTVTFWWTLAPDQAGEYEGTAWLGLRVGFPGDTNTNAPALAAPRLGIRVIRLFFLSGPAARWGGGAFAVLGLSIWIWRLRYA